MAKDNLFFKKLAVVHVQLRTPVFAIVALGAWSAVLVCAGELGQFQKLIEGVIFIGWIFYGLGAAAIFPIRRTNGDKPIPYRVPGYPWTPILFVLAAAAIVGNAVLAAFHDPDQFRNLKFAIALLVVGLPVYLIWRKRPAA
jgi:APA family basic amino acid/polyamine antiporter